MPTYEYYCGSCNQLTELFTTFSNRPDFVSCSSCGKPANLSLSGSHFKVKGANANNNYSGDSNYKWIKPRTPK